MKKQIGIVAAGLITFSLCARAAAQDYAVPGNHPIFRLGVFDGASNEFAQGAPYVPPASAATIQPTIFYVRQGSKCRDWHSAGLYEPMQSSVTSMPFRCLGRMHFSCRSTRMELRPFE